MRSQTRRKRVTNPFPGEAEAIAGLRGCRLYQTREGGTRLPYTRTNGASAAGRACSLPGASLAGQAPRRIL